MTSARVDPEFWTTLFGRRAAGVKLSLDEVRRVFDALSLPARRCVQVVGTNGKGSTVALLDGALRAHGLCVGRYTSPHLIRVTERVVVDGAAVQEAALAAAVSRVSACEARLGLPRALTFFELLTLAALCIFDDGDVDVQILEAGLGGRLDATTVVPAQIIGVTRIALDHQAYLGNDLASVAAEKAGAFRAGAHLVSVPQDPVAWEVLNARARAVGADLVLAEPACRAPAGLPGAHQQQNAGLALALAGALDVIARLEDLDAVSWPGRMSRRPWGGGEVLVDVAHNLDGVQALVEAVNDLDGPPLGAVFVGTMADKPAAAMVQALGRLSVPVHFVKLDGGAPAPSGVGETFAGPDAERFHVCLAGYCARGQRVLVCGSHMLVGPVVALMQGPGSAPPDPQEALRR